ncbi:unnamed protein product [Nesidiocoris tenuis]|uniref:PiggyBac transposable element-derived protein domain-containing protein n=1 Tax=Nesidiocoris tenuis TaxID=355587 RepID=A0A6H5G033_9HEMI|nr:unnamed protein product [Nesidiocoris tenuis]
MDKENSDNNQDADSDIEWMIDLIQRDNDNASKNEDDDDDDCEFIPSSEKRPKRKAKRTVGKGAKKITPENENERFLVIDVVRIPPEKATPSKDEPKVPFLVQAQSKGYKWLFLAPGVEVNGFSMKSVLSLHESVKKPIEFVKALFTDYFLDLIVEGTNSYALHMETSKTDSWKMLDVKELKHFIALLFGMGLVQMETLDDYWLNYSIISVPGLSALMARHRFLNILKYLCFTRVKKPGDYKDSVVSILTFFENRMNSIYSPGRDLQLWKPVVLGGTSYRNINVLEKRRDELQLCLISECGHDRNVYLRAQLDLECREIEENPKRDLVVKDLSDHFAARWRRLFLDEYYTSVRLAVELHRRKIYCTGFIRADHPDNPDVLKSVPLNNGQCSQTYLSNGLCLAKWKNTSDKYMLSCDISGRLTKVSSGVVAPEMFFEYSRLTKTDIEDRLKFIRHPCSRELEPYRHLVILVFEMMLSNACEFYNMRCANSSSRMTLTQFRKILVLEFSGTIE